MVSAVVVSVVVSVAAVLDSVVPAVVVLAVVSAVLAETNSSASVPVSDLKADWLESRGSCMCFVVLYRA